MQRKRARQLAVPAIMFIAVVGGGAWYLRHRHAPLYYTGFVEGEERIIRSEVTGRVLQVKYAEGDAIPAEEIIAVLDDRDIQARIKSKQEEIAVLEAEQRTQAERVTLVESTWARDVSARPAELLHEPAHKSQSQHGIDIAKVFRALKGAKKNRDHDGRSQLSEGNPGEPRQSRAQKKTQRRADHVGDGKAPDDGKNQVEVLLDHTRTGLNAVKK